MSAMFHVELRQSFHTARAFNLSEPELRDQILTDWTAGRTVRWAERQFSPEKASLTIVSGPELRPDEMGMGRGWQQAVRDGQDVTEQLLRGSGPETDFKAVVLALSGEAPVTPDALLEAAEARWPHARLSERVALCEQAVWELLHQGEVALRLPGDPEPTPPERWQEFLLRTASWTGGAASPTIARLKPSASR